MLPHRFYRVNGDIEVNYAKKLRILYLIHKENSLDASAIITYAPYYHATGIKVSSWEEWGAPSRFGCIDRMFVK